MQQAMQQALQQGFTLTVIGFLLGIPMTIFVNNHPGWTDEPLDARRRALLALSALGLLCVLAGGVAVYTAYR